MTEFSQCPACKGTTRFYENLGQKIVLEGIAPTGFKCVFQQHQSVVGTEDMKKQLKEGKISSLPTTLIQTDICSDCGCIYVVRMDTGKLSAIAVPKIILPPNVRTDANKRG